MTAQLAILACMLLPGGGGVALAQGTTGPQPPTPRKAWQRVGHITHPPIQECSGIVASRQYPGIFWVHNDSGHQAILYAIKETGELVAEVQVTRAPNIDWEDIAADDQGNLYIADTGNNFGLFPTRSIHRLQEPDPTATPVPPAPVTRSFSYVFPNERFDAEALCVHGDRMWIVSKPRGGALSAIYRLDPKDESKYQPVQTAALDIRAAAGADLSPDGTRMVICNAQMVWVLTVDRDGALVPDAAVQQVRHPGEPIEACCFDGQDVVLASEQGDIYRISKEDLAAGTRFLPPSRLNPQTRPSDKSAQ